MKKLLTILLLSPLAMFCQTAKVATSTATTAPVVYTQAGVDALLKTVNSRIAALESRATAAESRIAALESQLAALPVIRKGTADTLNSINIYFTALQANVTALQAGQLSLQKAIDTNTANDNILKAWADRVKLISLQ